jgi:hypothetical protein
MACFGPTLSIIWGLDFAHRLLFRI